MIRIELAILMLLTITLFASGKSQAALTLTPKVEGLSSGTYKPLTTPALTGSNFAATGKVLINGKFVNIPGYIPPAGTAAAAAKTSLWSNPFLTGVALLGWSNDAGLNSDGSTWTKSFAPASTTPTGTTTQFWFSYVLVGPGYGTCNNRGAPDAPSACSIWGGDYTAFDQKCFMTQGECTAAGYTGCSPEGNSFNHGTCEATVQNCPPGYSPFESSCTLTDPALAAKTSTQLATQADFEALPSPPTQALAELAPQVGVPVEAPVYAPITQQIGSAYTKPDGSTWEPWATFSPAGDGQVTADTYDKQITDSTGAPVTQPTNQDTQEQPPTESQCDKYPNTLGCANLDQPTAENLNQETRNVSLISPVTVGNAGSCPAPLTASFMGQTVEFKFDPLCQFANTLRPLVLSLAWLGAGFIFVGGVRNE